MSVISLIAQLEKEDQIKRKEHEEHFLQQNRKFKELEKKITYFRDENKKIMDSITKGLDHLINNKHTIDNALKQTDIVKGLPIPYDQHEIVVDFISKATGLLNNTDKISTHNAFSPDEILQDVESIKDDVEISFKECHTEFTQIQCLDSKSKLLKSLIDNVSGDTSQKSL